MEFGAAQAMLSTQTCHRQLPAHTHPRPIVHAELGTLQFNAAEDKCKSRCDGGWGGRGREAVFKKKEYKTINLKLGMKVNIYLE